MLTVHLPVCPGIVTGRFGGLGPNRHDLSTPKKIIIVIIIIITHPVNQEAHARFTKAFFTVKNIVRFHSTLVTTDKKCMAFLALIFTKIPKAERTWFKHIYSFKERNNKYAAYKQKTIDAPK